MFNSFGTNLVEAAIAADVKLFFPSEFGGDYDDPAVTSNSPLASKITVTKLLRQNQSHINHTIITNGMFLDWGFDNGFLGFDIPNHTVTLYDEGKTRLSGAILPNIGKAVVAAIHHPELTLNKRIFIADTTFTQLEALALFEKYTNTKWTVKHVSTNDLEKEAAEKLANGNIGAALVDYVRFFAYNSGLKVFLLEGRTSNKALGIPTLSLDQIVQEAVQRANSTQ